MESSADIKSFSTSNNISHRLLNITWTKGNRNFPKQVTLSTTYFGLLGNLLNSMLDLSKHPIYAYMCISVLLQTTIVIRSCISAKLDVGKNLQFFKH